MFVGGPNQRKDFHIQEGNEFFFQLRGKMELVTLEQDQRDSVKIEVGQVFCLPSRVPHSPQRKTPGSLGLVIERRREKGEMDGLIYYTDFEKCDSVQWEKFFPCTDLRKNLPCVIGAYNEFLASEDSKNKLEWPESNRPMCQDRTCKTPLPFSLEDFLSDNSDKLAIGNVLPLFGPDHPANEFQVLVVGGPKEQVNQCFPFETWLYQLHGDAYVTVTNGTLKLTEGCCCIVEENVAFEVYWPAGSVGLMVQEDPRVNKNKGSAP